jgi:hypothetical protein
MRGNKNFEDFLVFLEIQGDMQQFSGGVLDPVKVCIVWRSPFTLTRCCWLWKPKFQVFMSIHLFEVDQCSFEVSIICRLGFEYLRIEQ